MVYDIIVVALFALLVFLGYKRGFFLMIMRFVALAAALIVAAWLATPISNWAYDTFLDETVKSSVSAQIEESKGSITDKLDKTVSGLPGILRNSLDNAGIYDGEDLLATIGVADDTTDKVLSESVADKVIKPLSVALISSLCNIVLFIICIVVFSFIVTLLNKTMEFPVLKQANGILGIVVGAIEGVVCAWAISILLFSVARGLPQNSIISYESLEQTHIVKVLGESKSLRPADILEEFTISTEKE